MIIAVDARWIFSEISGIGHYTRELLRHLLRIDRSNRYIFIFCDDKIRSRFVLELDGVLPGNARAETVPYSVFAPSSQLQLPRLLRRWKVDVYHSTNYMIPFVAFPRDRTGKTACVTTIHDVIPIIFREHAPLSRKSRLFPLFYRVMREAARRSDAIISVSHASANDVVKHLHISDTAKVHAIHNGVTENYTPATKPTPLQVGTKTILYVGRCDPYKNIDGLVRAFAVAKRELPFPVQLVLAGSPDPRYPQAAEAAAQLGVTDSVSWTGYLSDEELLRTYRGADLLAHPSRYEGFGLQILEAMACGVPVVAGTGGALAEVVAGAGLAVDPDDTNEFAARISEVLSNDGLAQSLSKKGIARAKEFSWESTAVQTLKVYSQFVA